MLWIGYGLWLAAVGFLTAVCFRARDFADRAFAVVLLWVSWATCNAYHFTHMPLRMGLYPVVDASSAIIALMAWHRRIRPWKALVIVAFLISADIDRRYILGGQYEVRDRFAFDLAQNLLFILQSVAVASAAVLKIV